MDLDKGLFDLLLSKKGRFEEILKCELKETDLAEEYRPAFVFLKGFWMNPKRSGELPTPELFVKRFPWYEIPAKKALPKDDITSILEAIHRRSLYNHLRDGVVQIEKLLKEDKVDDASRQWVETQSKLSLAQHRGRVESISSTSAERKADYLEREGGGRIVNGTPTGFQYLDNVLKGWQPGDMILWIAKSGEGKTWFALKSAHSAQWSGLSVLFVSPEMRKEKVVMRYDALNAGVPYRKLRDGLLDKHEKAKYFESLAKKAPAEFFVFESVDGLSSGTPNTIYAYARERGCKYVVIDGVYMLSSDHSGKGKNFALEVGAGLRQITLADGTIIYMTNQMDAEETPSAATLDNSKYGKAFGEFCDVGGKIFRTIDNRMSGVMQVQLLKTREEDLPSKAHLLKWDLLGMDLASYEDNLQEIERPDAMTPDWGKF